MESAAHRLASSLARQLDALSTAPLADLAGGRSLGAPEPATISLLLERREELAAWLRTPACAAALASYLARWLWRKNQYVRLDRAAMTAACAQAAAALAEAAEIVDDPKDMSERMQAIGAALQGRIAAMLQASGPARPADVVCSEYAVTLQRDALGLGDERLTAPILDVGCGRSAGLVRALRAEGLEATGVDREAPDDAIAGDWLTFPFGQDRWGTIVSHQAFSLHFLHHHLAGGAEAYAYARVYMAALQSLRVGGRFVYAPGLPFIEEMLSPRSYRRVRVPLPAAMIGETVLALERATGLDLGYAAHVERVA